MTVTNLSQLVLLFERTHHELQRRVARAADSALVVRNWLFGYYLVEYEGAGAARADLYGKALMERLAASLTERGIRGMSARSLYRFRALYEAYQDILPEELAESPRALERSADILPEGLAESRVLRPAPPSDDAFGAMVRALGQRLSLGWTLELGKGFLFEARQKRFSFDNDHFYVDLVFYNRLLRCYVLIDLKLDKLTHQDLGQMQMYVNYFDRYVKTPDEARTIGMLLCRRKSDALVELTLPEGANIHASEYQLYLPSKEELRAKLMVWTKELDA